jgi:hypothetical protein
MAAGLGFKDFTTGEVLTAADVDGYLMQGVWVFASAAARDAAVTSPQEGNFAYLKDTNVTTYYTGSAWANLDTTGMTNPMTTTGDTIYSSSGSTPARLGIGSAGQVLTVASGVPSWATPSGGGSGLTLIDEVSFTSSNAVNVNNVFSSTYENYRIVFVGINGTLATISIRLRLSGSDTTTGYEYVRLYVSSGAVGTDVDVVGNDEFFSGTFDTTNKSLYSYDISSPNLATQTSIWGGGGAVDFNTINLNYGSQTDSTQFTGFSLICAVAITGKVSVYGYAKE